MNENYGYQQVNPTNMGSLTTYVSSVMRSVYLKMFVAMIVTAFTAMFFASSPALLGMVYGIKIIFFGLIIAEFGVVFALSGMINKLSSAVAFALLMLFSVLNGVTLSSVLIIYTATSVATTFFITAGVFAAMSVFGYVTKTDLTKFGSILFMALIGLIICSLVNLFMNSTTMEWIISGAGVLIFVGLTAWDTQRIKQMAALNPGFEAGKLSTIGALRLYLDFVNLFLYLLRFFGNSRD